ncbi:serine/threonine-protein kinase phg2-like [Penaeus monodon]|uniref:serine/threonine-protein kinase phg2-like n=1 Tax=Penaeus monodon TaxID=6687 RepID=UPI0018A722B0|nr:serine/threonine-protein kinase phg2-like [Penaeus monodon]
MGLASVVTWWCLAAATWQGAAGERVMMATEYEAKEPLLREGHRVDPLAAYARLSMLVAQKVREGADQKEVLRSVLHQVLGQHRRRRPQEKRFVTSPSGRLEKDALKDWLTWRIRREAAQAMLQSLDVEGGEASFVRQVRLGAGNAEGGVKESGEAKSLMSKKIGEEKHPREGESDNLAGAGAQRGRVRREDPAVMYVPVGGASGADSCPDSVDAAAVSISQLVFLSLSLGVFSAVANIANNINNNNDNNNNNNDNNINSNNLNLAANANSGNQITVQLPPPTGRKRRHLQLLWERHLAALRSGSAPEEAAAGRGAPTRSPGGVTPSHPRSEDDVATSGAPSEGDAKASGPRRELSSGDEAPGVSASLMSLAYENHDPHDRQERLERAPYLRAKGPEGPLKQSSRESSPSEASSRGIVLSSSPPPSRLSLPLQSSPQQQVMLRNSPIIQHSSQVTLSSPVHLSLKPSVSPLSSVILLPKSLLQSSHSLLPSLHNQLSLSNAQSPPKPTLVTPQSTLQPSHNAQSPHNTPQPSHNSPNSSQTSPQPHHTSQPSHPSPTLPHHLRSSPIPLKSSRPSPSAPSPPTCRSEGVAATWALKGMMTWLLTSPRPLPPCLGLHLCGLVRGAAGGGAWGNALAGYYLLTSLHEHTNHTFSDFLKEARLGTCRSVFPDCEEVLLVSDGNARK